MYLFVCFVSLYQIKIKMTKKLDRKIKMAEKESIPNHLLFKSY